MQKLHTRKLLETSNYATYKCILLFHKIYKHLIRHFYIFNMKQQFSITYLSANLIPITPSLNILSSISFKSLEIIGLKSI